jgi:hypothetical protein
MVWGVGDLSFSIPFLVLKLHKKDHQKPEAREAAQIETFCGICLAKIEFLRCDFRSLKLFCLFVCLLVFVFLQRAVQNKA